MTTTKKGGSSMDIDTLKYWLEYDQNSGVFRWKNSPHASFKVGDVVGSVNNHGYWTIRLKGKLYQAHRLAFLYCHGFMPKQVDHINGVRSDNRLTNLRAATSPTNQWNRSKNTNNTTGFKGVFLFKPTGKYQAKIGVNNKKIHLGYFDSAEEASEAYKQAARLHHGDFARF